MTMELLVVIPTLIAWILSHRSELKKIREALEAYVYEDEGE